MSMRLTDKVFAKSRGSAENVVDFARRNGAERIDFLTAWANEVYRLAALAGMDASLPIAQSHLETGGWKQNKYWNQGNPAGIGITGHPDSDEIVVMTTGEQAARCQMVHLALYATGGTPTALQPYKAADYRYDDYLAAFGPVARARTIEEFGGGNWAVDPEYSEEWVDRGNLIWPRLPNQEAGPLPDPDPNPNPTPDVPHWTAIPGLPGGKLGTDYPVRIRLIPLGANRSGRKASLPRLSVQHGTGNPASESAWGEASFFVGGGGSERVAVHACSDHQEVVVTLPFDEVGVHAGSSVGNNQGFADEMMEGDGIWSDPTKYRRMIAITADFMGRVAARLNVENPNRHADYGNPGCPNKLQTVRIDGRLAWDIYVQLWRAARADELVRMNPAPNPDPDPDPDPEPEPPPTRRRYDLTEAADGTLTFRPVKKRGSNGT